ncbi:MAG: exonuclease domain-containing protein [Coriobacteriia bacterium]|nr:exonuclease domain-containing protein [Coriobacteriia bacterium]
MRFLAIDFETASARRDSACAVGVARVEDGQVVSSASYFIRPPGNQYDSFNIGIHGITPEMTANAASFTPVLDAVLTWADGLPLVAHNASFDMSVLRAGFEASGRAYPQCDYYCSLLLSRSAIPGLPDYKLPRVHAACGGTPGQHHEPKADAEACAEIVLSIAQTQGAASLEELTRRVGMQAGQLYECGYLPCRCAKGHSVAKSSKPMSDYVCNVDADQNGPFFDADVAFTGAMSSMSRDQAMQLVSDGGGRPRTSVSKLTEYVVVGELDHAAFMEGRPSSKLRKAMELISAGYSVQVLSEREFMSLLSGA